MNNNELQVRSSMRSTITMVAICFLVSGTAGAADDPGEGAPSLYKGSIPEKNTKFPKVSRDLLQLQQDFQTYDAQPQQAASKGPFAPQIKLMRTSGDYVVVDAIAENSASALYSDLLGIGAVNVTAHGSIVSARVPIIALQSLNQLSSLRFVRGHILNFFCGF